MPVFHILLAEEGRVGNAQIHIWPITFWDLIWWYFSYCEGWNSCKVSYSCEISTISCWNLARTVITFRLGTEPKKNHWQYRTRLRIRIWTFWKLKGSRNSSFNFRSSLLPRAWKWNFFLYLLFPPFGCMQVKPLCSVFLSVPLWLCTFNNVISRQGGHSFWEQLASLWMTLRPFRGKKSIQKWSLL